MHISLDIHTLFVVHPWNFAVDTKSRDLSRQSYHFHCLPFAYEIITQLKVQTQNQEFT